MEVRRQLLAAETCEDLDAIAETFVASAEAGTHKADGFGGSASAPPFSLSATFRPLDRWRFSNGTVVFTF